MITVDQIRSGLQQVIVSEISLDEFDEWLTRESWNMHCDSSAEAIRLVGRIELTLAEYESGSDAGEVLQNLRTMLPVYA